MRCWKLADSIARLHEQLSMENLGEGVMRPAKFMVSLDPLARDRVRVLLGQAPNQDRRCH